MPALTTCPRPAAESTTPPAPERISDLLLGWADRLPAPLARVITRDLVGYAVLSLVTFVVALLLLLLLDRVAGLPLTAAVLLADGTAWALNFWLNRTLNFRSRCGIGPQAARYGLVLCGELAMSASITTALAGLGLPIPVGRTAAGGFITLLGYLSCRFWVFRDRGTRPC